MKKMKWSLYALLAVFVLASCSEKTSAPKEVDQSFRSERPKPGPAPTITMGEAQKFELDNGLKVIVVENDKLPRVSYQLFFDRQPLVEGDKAGYTSMAGTLLGTGTKNRTKAELDEAVDFIGASFSTSSTGMFASGLSKHKEKLIDIMTDVLYNPSFPEEEFDKLRTQTLSGLQANKEDPNAIAGNVTSVINFGADHPYGEIVTEETVNNITLDDCKKYYKTYWKPNIAYLVVVGDVTMEEVKQDADKYFGDWKKGDVPMKKYVMPGDRDGRRVCFVHRDGSAQSVIRVTYPVNLKQGDPDVITASLMNNILGGGGFNNYLTQNLREGKGYTYGAGSSLSPDRYGGTFNASASVRNAVTDSAVTEFLYEMNRIRDELVDADALAMVKAGVMGSFARSMESPQTVANRVLNIERYGLPSDYYETYLAKVNAVTAEDIQRVARKYIHPDNANVVVVGSKDEAVKLARFASSEEVEYFDVYGNPKEMNETALPEGLTGGDVIDRYLAAIGGKETLMGVENIVMKMQLEGGPPVEMAMTKMDGKMLMEVSMSGMVLQKQVINGDKGYAEAQGQKTELNEEMMATMVFDKYIFPQMAYGKMDCEVNLESIEEVEGAQAYKVGCYTPEWYLGDRVLQR